MAGKMTNSDKYSLLLDETQIVYQVHRSRRSKNIQMTVDEEGTLRVTLPLRRRAQDIDQTLRDHKTWILRKIREARKKKRLPPPFQLKNGAQLPLLDCTYTLILQTIEKKRARWQFKNNTLTITAPIFTPSLTYRGVEQWYRRMARLFLEDRVFYWAARMNLTPHALRVKNQRTVWGSCSRKANLNFNWRILLLSAQTADYLIIHELAHLKELNHSSRFWQTVQKYSPDFEHHKAELKHKDSWLKFPSNTQDLK